MAPCQAKAHLYLNGAAQDRQTRQCLSGALKHLNVCPKSSLIQEFLAAQNFCLDLGIAENSHPLSLTPMTTRQILPRSQNRIHTGAHHTKTEE
jgi:hypothetical protein